MKVLVTGGRDYADRARVFEVLNALHARGPITRIVHGACGDDYDNTGERDPSIFKGADRWADEWAAEHGVPVSRYPAKWRRLKGNAGRERNRRMLKESLPGFVVAFPGGPGTKHMTSIAYRMLGPMFVLVVAASSRA